MISAELQRLADSFDDARLMAVVRGLTAHFTEARREFRQFAGAVFADCRQLGVVFGDAPLVRVKVNADLSGRRCREEQFALAKRILSELKSVHGLFVFHGAKGDFRLSLVDHRKRQTFVLERGAANRCLKMRLARRWNSWADVEDAFSAEKLRQEFLSRSPELSVRELHGRFLGREADFTLEEGAKDEEFVALGPELLGQLFEMRLAGRKRSGAFYTPRPVVDYMVEECLIQRLKAASPEAAVRSLVVDGDATGIAAAARPALVAALTSCKIIDPACGCGAFLVGALQAMLRVWDALEPAADDGYRRKLTLLESCLHGVDLMPEAIEVCKLRLALALLAERPSEPPPSLDKNFVVADALSWAGGGFDVVIGNPPYVSYGLRGVGRGAAAEHAELKRLYPDSAEYKISLYALFMDKAMRLCAEGGVQSMIVPDSFLLGKYFSKIRKEIVSANSMLNIVFLPYRVFDAVVGASVVYLFRKGVADSGHRVAVHRSPGREAFERRRFVTSSVEQRYYQGTERNRFRLFFDDATFRLVNKIEENCRRVGDYVRFSSGLIGKKGQAALVSDTPRGADWLPGLVSGGEVSRFAVKRAGKYLHYDKAAVKSGFAGVRYFEPKLFLRQTGDSLICALDSDNLLALNNVHVGNALDGGVTLKYIVCLLNSSLMNYYYKAISLESGRAMAQTDIDVIASLPVKAPTDAALKAIDLLYPHAGGELLDALFHELYFPDEIEAADAGVLGRLGEPSELAKALERQRRVAEVRLCLEEHTPVPR